MLHFLTFLSVSLACLVIGGEAAAQVAHRPVLRVVTSFHAESPVGFGTEAFLAALRERLSDRLVIEFARVDGSAVDLLREGKADIAIASTTDLNRLAENAFGVFDLPFLFASLKEVEAVQHAVVAPSAFGALDRAGFVGLGFWNDGLSSVLTQTPIRQVKDLQGLKILVADDAPGSGAALMRAGASPVPGSVYQTAQVLNGRTADGVESSLRILTGLLPDAGQASWLPIGASVTPIRPVVATVVVGKDVWRKLSLRAQSIIAEEVAVAAGKASLAAFEQDAKGLANLRRNGQASAGDPEALFGSAAPTWVGAAGIAGTDVLKSVLPIISQTRGTILQPPPPTRRDGALDNGPVQRTFAATEYGLAPGEVLFATDRAWESDQDPRYRLGSGRAEQTFGTAIFRLAAGRPLGNVDERTNPIIALDQLDEASFLDRAARALNGSERREIVIFIHGYHNKFVDASRTLALLAADVRFGALPILYSWPSDGVAMRYPSDEEEVRASRDEFLAFLKRLSSIPGLAKIHVAAHSMGNRLVVEAMDRLAVQSAGHPLPPFHHVVMAAPDVYVTLFQQTAASFVRHARRVTIYASDGDQALACSRKFHSNRRLGEAGQDIFVSQGIETIDASGVGPSANSSWFPCSAGHSYLMRNARVQADLQTLFLSELPPGSRHGLIPKERGGLPYWVFRPAD